MTRYLSWFSAGAASAVATKLALSMYDDVTIYRTDPGSEHPDNKRFSDECAEWFGQEVHMVTGGDYADTCNHADDPDMDCSLLCAIAEDSLGDKP